MAEIDDHLLRILFDTATGSVNFGSGFLDDEEVAALREVAVLIGVDPDAATPDNFKCKYRGHHRPQVFLETPMFTGPDGIWRNAYRARGYFPEDVRGKLEGTRGSDDLGLLRAKMIGLWCQDCGQRWGALDPSPQLAVRLRRCRLLLPQVADQA